MLLPPKESPTHLPLSYPDAAHQLPIHAASTRLHWRSGADAAHITVDASPTLRSRRRSPTTDTLRQYPPPLEIRCCCRPKNRHHRRSRQLAKVHPAEPRRNVLPLKTPVHYCYRKSVVAWKRRYCYCSITAAEDKSTGVSDKFLYPPYQVTCSKTKTKNLT